MDDTETELLQLLDPSSRGDVKGLAVQHLLGMTGSTEGRTYIAERGKLMTALFKLVFDNNAAVKAEAEKCVVNLTAEKSVVESLVKLGGVKDVIVSLLQRCIDIEKSSNFTVSILNNLTRLSDGADFVARVIEDSESVSVANLVDAVCNLHAKQADTLVTLSTLLMNLTQVSSIRQALMVSPDHLLLRLLAIVSLSPSLAVCKGVVGAIKNCCFEYEFHSWLLSEDMNLLSRLLLPLAGPEEFDDDDMERLPLDLQYLPNTKQREADPDVRLMLVQAVHKLLSTKTGRLHLKDKNVYVIMRELHKAETNDENNEEIMNVIDILIADEPQEGMDDLHKVEIPEKVLKKFESEAS